MRNLDLSDTEVADNGLLSITGKHCPVFLHLTIAIFLNIM